jgi:hypothetical protein
MYTLATIIITLAEVISSQRLILTICKLYTVYFVSVLQSARYIQLCFFYKCLFLFRSSFCVFGILFEN